MKAIAIVTLALVFCGGAGRAEMPVPSDQSWGIYRNGERIGSRTTRFESDGDNLIAKTASEVEIKIAFFTVFERTEEQREVWHNGELVEFVSKVDDDGDKYLIKGHRTAEGFEVNGYGRPRIVPDGTVPATLWNFQTVKAKTLLDTKRGRTLKVRTAATGPEPIAIDGAEVPATRYAVRGDHDVDLWYDADGTLLSALFVTDKNSRIEFLPERVE